MTRAVRLVVLISAMLALHASAMAGPITLAADTRGNYRSDTGMFAASNSGTAGGNYLTGVFNNDEWRSFFTFDLSSLSGTFSSASFRINTEDHGTNNLTETLQIWDYSGSIGALNGNTAGFAGFNDLGSGTSFGSLTIGVEGIYDIAFNAAGLAALNSAIGGNFAFGLTMPTALDDQYIARFSGAGQVPTALVGELQPAAIPEPASLLLFGSGAAIAALRQRRRAART